MEYLSKSYILVPSQTPSIPVTIWSSPVVSAVTGSLITVVLGGVFVKLWWELIETDKRRLAAEKDKEIMRLEAEKDKEIILLKTDYQSAVKEKELEIKDIKAQYEDKVRDLNYELTQLKTKCFQNLEEDYDMFRATLIKVNERLKQELKQTKIELVEKERQIQELADELDNTLLNKLVVQKEELETRQKIFEEYLSTLDSFRKRMQVYQASAIWLDRNREELVSSAVKYVLTHNPRILQNKSETEQEDLIRKFKSNVDDYIDWIRFSLNRGRPINLAKINLQPEVPGFALVEAFKFIKKERAAQELPDDVADELGSFVSDLVAYFSSSVFRQESD
jgi:hypothetical protein